VDALTEELVGHMSKHDAYPATPTSWEGTIVFDPAGFAHRPNQVLVKVVTEGEAATVEAVLVRFADARARTRAVLDPLTPRRDPGTPVPSPPPDASVLVDPTTVRFLDVPDVTGSVRELQSRGFKAQPNHVFFACCGCCGPHPSLVWTCGSSGYGATPFTPTPFTPTPFTPTPFTPTPFTPTPFTPTPYDASQFTPTPGPDAEAWRTGRRRSSARPAVEPAAASIAGAVTAMGGSGSGPKVVVLDTGPAGDPFRPAFLADIPVPTVDPDLPDADRDGFLDPCAGHSTFIAGIIRQMAPTARIVLERIYGSLGDVDELNVSNHVRALDDGEEQGTLLNLSFSGYALEHPEVLADAIRDVQNRNYTVVAAAGNDHTCVATFPASLPDVVSVGAFGPGGPAPFTNYGPWVRACAPGVDLVSWFFSSFNGPETGGRGVDDLDHFVNWARWSGTSFSAPVVVAALAREMLTFGVEARQAAARVIDGAGLLRIPDLGTVVNLH